MRASTHAHIHTHTLTHNLKERNIEKINNKSSVVSKWCQMEHTLSPRLCRLAAVLRSQLLSAFILLNLLHFSTCWITRSLLFGVFISSHRQKLFELEKVICVICSETNVRDSQPQFELGNAWSSVRSILMRVWRVRTGGVLISPTTRRAPHHHLICCSVFICGKALSFTSTLLWLFHQLQCPFRPPEEVTLSRSPETSITSIGSHQSLVYVDHFNKPRIHLLKTTMLKKMYSF